MKKIQFIKESLKSLQEVGTVLPSSKSVVDKMVDPIKFDKDIIIVELGSGTGVITKEILNRMSKKSKLICFETNSSFYKDLKEKFKDNIYLINDSAENMEKHIEQLNIKKIDYIVSSVPLLTLPKETTNKILLVSSQILDTDRKFIQLQYSKLLDKRLEKYFNKIDVSFTPKNYLPSFIYTCYNS